MSPHILGVYVCNSVYSWYRAKSAWEIATPLPVALVVVVHVFFLCAWYPHAQRGERKSAIPRDIYP